MELTYIIKDENGVSHDFETLYERHFQEIFHYLMHCLGSVADAEDVTAQVFMKAMKNLWRFKWTRGTFSAWLFRIAHNEMKSFYRRKSRLESQVICSNSVPDSLQVVHELEEAERHRQQNRFYDLIQKKIGELNPEEQSLLVLRFFQQKSYSELAGIFKVREGTLAMRIHRSLKKLKKKLDMEGLDHEEYRRSFESLSQA